MKKTFLLTLVALMCCNTDLSAQGWLKRLGERAVDAAKNSVENKVENKTREAVDDVLDGKSGKKSKKDSKSNDADYEEVENDEPAAQVGNQKSDFVRGSVVVFEDVVKGEQVGEFPSKWDLERGNAEIATVNGEQAIEFAKEDSWIKPLISKNPKNYFGDEFTVEFDLMYTEGGFEIDFMHPDEHRDSEIFTLFWGNNYALRLDYVRPDSESNSEKQEIALKTRRLSSTTTAGTTMPSRSTSVPSRYM